MKLFTYLLLFSLTIGLTSTSCKSDEDDPATEFQLLIENNNDFNLEVWFKRNDVQNSVFEEITVAPKMAVLTISGVPTNESITVRLVEEGKDLDDFVNEDTVNSKGESVTLTSP